MTWLAWLSYVTAYLFTFLSIISPSELSKANNMGRVDQSQSAVVHLNGLCVDNTRTQSWWTYTICLGVSIIQVHVDPRTKSITDRIHLGEYSISESTDTKQVYRTVDATCESPDNPDRLVHRTTYVTISCCDVVVHMMRQSRHTPSAKYANVAQRGGAYWVPEQAAAEAAAELKAARSSGTGPSGYRSSPSTATTEAYINSVEENTPCTYEIAICSDLVCSPGGPSPTGKPGAGPKGTASSGERSRGQTISTAHEDALQQFALSNEGTAASLAHPPLLQTLAVASSKRHTEMGAEVPAGAAGGTVSTEEQEELRERARAMFYHGYDAYMQHAYPEVSDLPL